MRRRVALAALALCCAAAVGAAQTTEWRALAKRYAALARNHDDEANRERRYVLLDMFPFRTEKACVKLLKKAYDDEKTIANRVAVVHLLSGSGNPRALDFLITKFKKEKARAPVIALGAGLGFTPRTEAGVPAAVAERVIKLLARAKTDDLRAALVQGLGELGDPSALPWLTADDDAAVPERFERNLALGRCGGEAVLPLLLAESQDALPDVRYGAARGLAEIQADGAWTALRTLVADSDERVVRCAADALVRADRKDAAKDIATALGAAASLRTREHLRGALRALLGRDLGYDAAAWQSLAAGGSPPAPNALPKLPTFFGLDVASDRFALLIDRSRSTGWKGRAQRMRDESAALIGSISADASFVLAAASRRLEPFKETWIDAAGRSEATDWIDGLQPGGGFDMRAALTELLERYPSLDTIVIATDSHPWGNGITRGSRETMEIFRRANRLRDIRLVIALVMPGGRYESSERSESEIIERVDYLAEMAEDSGGLFVNVEE